MQEQPELDEHTIFNSSPDNIVCVSCSYCHDVLR